MYDIWIWDKWTLVMRQSDPVDFSIGHQVPLVEDLDHRNFDLIYLRLGIFVTGIIGLDTLGPDIFRFVPRTFGPDIFESRTSGSEKVWFGHLDITWTDQTCDIYTIGILILMGTFRPDTFRMFISAIDIRPDALEPETFWPWIYLAWYLSTVNLYLKHLALIYLDLVHLDLKYFDRAHKTSFESETCVPLI